MHSRYARCTGAAHADKLLLVLIGKVLRRKPAVTPSVRIGTIQTLTKPLKTLGATMLRRTQISGRSFLTDVFACLSDLTHRLCTHSLHSQCHMKASACSTQSVSQLATQLWLQAQNEQGVCSAHKAAQTAANCISQRRGASACPASRCWTRHHHHNILGMCLRLHV